MYTEIEQLKLKEKNAEATAEYYMHKYYSINDRESIGVKIGNGIDKCIKKMLFMRRKIKNKKMVKKALQFNENGLNKIEKREKKIVVSLTSYPARINAVPATIGSLLKQTVKPDIIVLWLGEEKFPEKKLPKKFEKLKDIGVEIRFRPDLKSHTKYFYAIQEFPNDIIITVDDDNIYKETLVEELYESYKKYPNCVSALRVHRIRFNNDFTLKKYADWHYDYIGEVGSCSHQYFATGVGGVLYPPQILHNETTNVEFIRKYCPNHDDFWLKIMEVMNNVKVVLASQDKMSREGLIMGTQSTGQWKENVVGGGNDRQMAAVMSSYNYFLGEGKELSKIMALDL